MSKCPTCGHDPGPVAGQPCPVCGAPAPAPYGGTGGAGGTDKTVKATWKTAHPSAKNWADRRRTSMGGQIRRTPKPLRIMLGTVLIGLGAWLIVSHLPTRKPLSEEERAVVSRQAGADLDRWRFSSGLYRAAHGAAGGFALIGLLLAVRGAFFRTRARARCRRCEVEVVADVDRFHLRCPNGSHPAQLRIGAIALLGGFLGCAILLAVLFAAGALKGAS